MNILFVAAEATPLAKTGGLADVVGSLPKELRRAGHDVRIIIPCHREVSCARLPITAAAETVRIDCGGRSEEAGLALTAIDGVPVYLLVHEGFFDRDYLYGTPAGDYPDNAERFTLFCRAALRLVERVAFVPDVIHCHDWHTALIPILLRHEVSAWSFFRRSAVVYTIHNLAYQGLFPPGALGVMGLDPGLFTMEQLEFYGKVNLMKGAILGADAVTTVSPTYREEILGPEEGCGLDGVLRVRAHNLHGILNGLDYGVWNPATDRTIVANFSEEDAVAGKRTNKAELQRELGLEVDASIPLIAMVSRLSAQKGVDLVARLLPGLARQRVQVVIVGVGDERYMRLLRRIQRLGRPNLAINLSFAPHLATKIYAGADIFLMPSHYEPCGLGQLIALRYGTVPVVRRTGGLADTVVDPADNPEAATGYVFEDYSAAALQTAIDRALAAYSHRPLWEAMVRRGMSCDFSWGHSARDYEALYEETLIQRRKD
jgi:starch synthase